MKTIAINNTWLATSGFRLDATFHLSDGPLTKLKLTKSPYPISKLSTETKRIFKGNIFKRTYVSSRDYGFPFMTASDMMQSDISGDKFISKKYTDTKDLTIERGWILVSRSGTLGNTVYTNENFEDVIGTDDLIRIVPNNKRVKSGYLYAFLSSKYGRGLLTQSGYGGVVKHIEPHHIENLPIPILPEAKQLKIHDLIVQSSILRTESKTIKTQLLQKISDYFENVYGRIEDTKISVRSITDINCFEKRFDAPYNIGSGRNIYNNIIADQHLPLSNLAEIFHPILFGKKQLKGSELRGNALYKSSSMMRIKPETDFWLSPKKISAYSKLQVKEGWVLISRTGTVGNVVRINKSMNNVFIDDHMIRVKPQEKYSGFIYVFLKSCYGQKLIQFQKYGSVQDVINSEYIERIPIPSMLLKPEILNEFNVGVQDASDKIDMAYKNENKAISLIENEIESWQK